MPLPHRRSRPSPAACTQADATHLLALTDDLLCTLSLEGRLLRMSAAFAERTGAQPGTGLLDLIHPEDGAGMRERINPLALRGSAVGFEARLRDRAGGWLTLRWRARADSEAGEIVLAGRALHDPAAGPVALFEAAFAAAPVGMAVVGIDGGIERANGALAALTGRSAQGLVGMHLAELVSPADLPTQAEQIARLLAGALAATTLEQELVGVDGRHTPVHTVISAARRPDGSLVSLLVQVRDTGEHARLQAQLRFEAEHDPLTGLLNRSAFTGALGRQISHARRYGRPGLLAVIDLDGFHAINDAQGTAVGDALLRTVATALRERLRDTDVLARLGSDEFGVLLCELDGERAVDVVEDLLRTVERRTLALGGDRAVTVTASAGLAALGAAGAATPEEAFTEADLALAFARESGARGRAALFDAAIRDRRAVESVRRGWAEKLRGALETGSFLLDCQPIVTAASEEPVAYELLLRMLDDDGSLVRPNAFLSIAERFGLMPAIDEWVIGQAVGMAAARADAQRPVTLAVNVSGESVGDGALLRAVCDLLIAHPEAGQHLVFELAERTVLSDLRQSQRFIARLGEFGCRFALDDFGAGLGAISHLRALPFDYVKLDGSFTRELPTSTTDQAIVQALVDVARSLGRTTVAECVEDDAILTAVRGYGIELAQGLRVGRPARVSEVLGLEVSPVR